jgi:AraC-like DNA-binding protein
MGNADTALVSAVQRASAGGSLHALAELLASAQHLPRSLRAALIHACLSPAPVYSVAELASSVHCDRTTLCLQWRKTVGPGACLRLVDFLGLVLLLHAARRRLAGHRTVEIASELGVHEHTLRRLGKRLVGDTRCTPEEEGKRETARLDAFIRTHLLRADCESFAGDGVEQPLRRTLAAAEPHDGADAGSLRMAAV